MLVPEHTPGGHRRYDLAKLRPEQFRPLYTGYSDSLSRI